MKWGGYRSPAAKKKAIVVVAHALLVIIWHVSWPATPPSPSWAADFVTRRLDPERETRRLIARLEALGHQVSLQPAA